LSRNAKLLILAVGILAILYVLISPLPEMDAVELSGAALAVLAMLVIGTPLVVVATRVRWIEPSLFPKENHDLLSALCVRKC